MIHGFIRMTGLVGAARQVQADIADWIKGEDGALRMSMVRRPALTLSPGSSILGLVLAAIEGEQECRPTGCTTPSALATLRPGGPSRGSRHGSGQRSAVPALF
jgi:hypothetical protein